MGDPPMRKDDAIVGAVVDMLESGGYDAIQLRIVARHAQVSLRTIYKYFPTRDDLIVAALERWMNDNIYSRLADPPAHESLHGALMWGLRHVLEPWERNPRMLEAFHRGRIRPGGERLGAQGFGIVDPLTDSLLAKLDPVYADDIKLILTLATLAAIARFVAGNLAITDILPMLERTVFRLTTDNAVVAAQWHRAPRQGRHGTVNEVRARQI
jgi:TetR/AcrR family transcriptional regulator, cholesterol catabolism regulator